MKPADLINFRERFDLTQTAAADLIGVTLRTWQRWEWGTYEVPESHKRLIKLISLPGIYAKLLSII